MRTMYGNNPKIIAFLIGLIFSMAAFTGAVSAVNSDVNPVSDIPVFTTGTSINYAIIETNTDPDYNAGKLVKKKTLLINNLSKKSDQQYDPQFKKQKQGIENLKTISTGGIPPKGFDEMVADNIPKIKSMINTVKTKITNIAALYKKLK